ncbi:hypothetical protein [Streptomyces sp. NPDC004788]
MTPRIRRARVSYDRVPAPYRSNSCRIGSHHECEHAGLAVAPADVPVVYETCTCPCHRATSSVGGAR